MSYAGFLDRVRAKNYATMRTPTNVNVYGPNSFTCVPPSILSPPPPSKHCSDNSSSCCSNNHHNHHDHHDHHHDHSDDDTCSQITDHHTDCGSESQSEPSCHPSPPLHFHPGGVYGNNIPIGAIVFNYGTTLPYGWLRCNGNVISSVKYAALIQVIGTAMLPNIPPLYPGGYYMIKY